MEKDELITLWAEKLFTEFVGWAKDGNDEETIEKTKKILSDLYDVGVQDGRDQEKLAIQLTRHGEPAQ